MEQEPRWAASSQAWEDSRCRRDYESQAAESRGDEGPDCGKDEGEQREGTGWLQGSPVIQERSKVRGSQGALAPSEGDVRRVQVSFSVCRWTHKVCGACREKTADRNAPGAVPSSDSRTLTWTSACKRARFDVKHAKNAKIVLEYREVHLQSVLQAISSRRSSNSIEEGCWCLQYTHLVLSTSHLHNHLYNNNKELALWHSHHPAWMGVSHRWVPV